MIDQSSIAVDQIRTTLSKTPAVVQALIAGAPKEALEFREAPEAWTPVEVLSHMADGEITDWVPRMQKILSGDANKTFTPFDREGGLERYRGWSASALVQEFKTRRSRNLSYLSTADLGEAALELTGVHPELGTVTLRQLLACWATHDLAHVAQISRILVRYFGGAVGPWRAYFSLLR